MPIQTRKAIGVAYPFREIDRQDCCLTLGRALPPMKPGSVLARCASCYREVVVGPLLDATGLRVICAMCAHHVGMEGF